MWKGAILMIGAAMLVPFGDGVAKYAHQNYAAPASFMAWSRFALGAIIFAPFALSAGIRARDMAHGSIILRGILIGLTVWLILQAAAREPLANVFGAFFIAPILSFGLAVFWLKERPERARWILTILGFCGVLLVVRPSLSMSFGMSLAVLSGLFYGVFLTLNRRLAGHHRPMAMLWAQIIVAALVLLPMGLDTGSAQFGPGLFLCIGLSAASSTMANLMLVIAYSHAEATRLAPLVYTQLISATIWGFVLFGAMPDLWAFVGLSLLILSGFAALTVSRSQAGSR